MILNPKLAREISDYVNHKVSILDVLKATDIKLTQSGGIWKSFCPFHNDKDSPSFTVKQDLNYVHCFGCNNTWFPVKFVMEYEHKTWSEAVQQLAQTYNLNLSAFEREPSDNEKIAFRAKEVNEAAAEWIHKQADKHSRAKQYLLSRYDEATIDKWQLGYCDKGEKLIEFLLKKCKFDHSLIEKVDIRPFMFNDRIVYPVFDMYGSIVGFSCRVWALSKAEEEEKYKRDKKNGYYRKFVNTSAKSILFKYKSSNLYGLNFARKSLAKNKGTIILVEGCSDVILMHKYGFENCAGILSLSFNKHTMTALADVAVQKVIFCLDGDSPGQKRTLDILTAQKKQSVEIPEEAAHIFYSAISIPGGEDPDEFLAKENNIAIMKKMLDKPMSLPEFYIHSRQKERDKIDSLSDKLEYIFDIKKNLAPLLPRAEMAVITNHLKQTLSISDMDYLEHTEIKSPIKPQRIEDKIISWLIQSRDFRDCYINAEFTSNMFSRGYASLFNIIREIHHKNKAQAIIADSISVELVIEEAKKRHIIPFFGSEANLKDIIAKPLVDKKGILSDFYAHLQQKQIKKFVAELNVYADQHSSDEIITFIKENLITMENKS